MKTTYVFLDSEFSGLHQNTSLISLALVADSGESFYAELNDYRKDQIDEWLQKNVINNLILWDSNPLTANSTVYEGDSSGLKDELSKWLSQFERIVMVCDCYAYDWTLFCEIFGGAFGVPKNVFYIPVDISTLFLLIEGDSDISREKYAGPVRTPGLTIDERDNYKHNALWDAFVIMECFKKLLSKCAIQSNHTLPHPVIKPFLQKHCNLL